MILILTLRAEVDGGFVLLVDMV